MWFKNACDEGVSFVLDFFAGEEEEYIFEVVEGDEEVDEEDTGGFEEDCCHDDEYDDIDVCVGEESGEPIVFAVDVLFEHVEKSGKSYLRNL